MSLFNFLSTNVLAVCLAASFLLGNVIVGETAASIFINELHYDNAGGDVGEFVEIAGPAGMDLTGFSIVFYNGANGTSYGTTNLNGFIIDDEGAGFGAIEIMRAGIQNGNPDGLALVDDMGTVLQFLSYEGSFTASGGAADGLTSMDIGVGEPTNSPIGLSLQLSGTGILATDFSWGGPVAESPGQINAGQVFSATTVIPEPSSMLVWGLLGSVGLVARRLRI